MCAIIFISLSIVGVFLINNTIHIFFIVLVEISGEAVVFVIISKEFVIKSKH